MICNHEEAEKDVALIDGYCPLCLSAELATLTALLREADKVLEPIAERKSISAFAKDALIARAAEIRKKIQEATNGL